MPSTDAPTLGPLTEAECKEIDAAMLQDKQGIPGQPLMDGYEQRRQARAMKLQINDKTGWFA